MDQDEGTSAQSPALWSPALNAPAPRDLCTDCGLSRTADAKRCGRACQFIQPDYPTLETAAHGRPADPARGDEAFFGVTQSMLRARLTPAAEGAQWTGITTALGAAWLAGMRAGVYPDRIPRVTYIIDFEHSAIGFQKIEMELTPESYCREIAMARTFGFVSDIEYLKSLGLIRGGSLENAVVLDSAGIVNNHLRFPDEFVRHKVLDAVGDLYLVGAPLLARFSAHKSGHALNNRLLRALLADAAAWEWTTFEEAAATPARIAHLYPDLQFA